jgi:CRISPR-associated endonuclease/helicase Cas3
MNEYVAHTSEDGRSHFLEEHLRETARLAGEYAGVFGCAGWGHIAGLWHDLGKYSDRFQQFIQSVHNPDAHVGINGGDHSTAGALHALEQFGMLGRMLAYPIAGHHAGLPDWQEGGAASLAQRLQQTELLEHVKTKGISGEILNQAKPADKGKSGTDLSYSFWVRMLFSCLVDADFLDTEAFFESNKPKERGGYPTLSMLLPEFDDYMLRKQNDAQDTPVNRIRAGILEHCRLKAAEPLGIFSLTVPTGGGKTLSSLAFALKCVFR